MPVTRSVEPRAAERSFFPWRRSLALRRSSIASRSLSRTSSSVATRLAIVIGLSRSRASSPYRSRAIANALQHVAAQLLVAHRALDVRLDALGCVVDLVSCLHVVLPFVP